MKLSAFRGIKSSGPPLLCSLPWRAGPLPPQQVGSTIPLCPSCPCHPFPISSLHLPRNWQLIISLSPNLMLSPLLIYKTHRLPASSLQLLHKFMSPRMPLPRSTDGCNILNSVFVSVPCFLYLELFIKPFHYTYSLSSFKTSSYISQPGKSKSI